jgi:hypothetical protein
MQKVYKTGLHPEKQRALRAGETLEHGDNLGRLCEDIADARLAIGGSLEDIPGRRRLRWTIAAHKLETVTVA